jgi:hypothetical protein
MTARLISSYFLGDKVKVDRLPPGSLKCRLSGISTLLLHKRGTFLNEAGVLESYRVADRFWWVRGSATRIYPNAGPGSYDDCLGTQEIFDLIDQGHEIHVMDGPFKTRDDAHYALDLAWESPE